MIQLSNEYKRNLLFTNTNKALLEIVKNATPEQLTQLKEGKDLKSVLSSLFQDKITGGKSDTLLLNMLKSAPQFKSMGNFSDNLKALLKELKSSGDLPTAALEKFIQNGSQLNAKNIQLQMNNSGVFMESKIAHFLQQSNEPRVVLNLPELKSDLSTLYQKLISENNVPNADKLLDGIEKLLNNLSNNTPKELKKIVQELKETPLPKELSTETAKIIPKLTALLQTKEPVTENNLRPILADDLKSSLMSLSKELQHSNAPTAAIQLDQIDKLLLQIDYHQLQSHLSNAASLFFPFEWDQLQEGSFLVKKRDEKKSYCSVNLKFKEYGELDLLMSLFDEHQLEIHFHTEKQSLNTLISEHLDELRKMLIAGGFVLKTIRVHHENDPEKHLHDAYHDDSSESYGGFEVKV